jgi:hypothetical protein
MNSRFTIRRVGDGHGVFDAKAGCVFRGSEAECRQFVATRIGGLILINGRLVDVPIKPVYIETDRQRLHRKLVNA